MRSYLLEYDIGLEAEEVEEFKPLPCRNISLTDVSKTKNNQKITRIFTAHRDHIEKLKLRKLGAFATDFFPTMNNLTELSIFTYFSWKEDPRGVKVDMPHLKSLILFNASTFIKHISSHKIETLKIADDEVHNSQIDEDHFIFEAFFETCVSLKHLVIQNFIFNIDLSNFAFKLSSIMILDFYLRLQQRDWFEDELEWQFKVLALIRAQKESLKKLVMEVETIYDPEIYCFMFNEMKLVELSVPSCIHEVMPVGNSTIKKLKTVLKNEDTAKFFELLKALRALEELDVEFCNQPLWNDFFWFLNHHMASLRKLTIRTSGDYDFRMSPEVWLQALQINTLVIRRFPKEIDTRMKFITCSPNITKLIISGDDNEILSLREFKLVLMSLAKLEKLEVRGLIQVDEDVLAMIMHSKLRHITIENFEARLVEVDDVCEGIKAACKHLVVIRRQVTNENHYDNEADKLVDMASWPAEDY